MKRYLHTLDIGVDVELNISSKVAAKNMDFSYSGFNSIFACNKLIAGKVCNMGGVARSNYVAVWQQSATNHTVYH